MLLFNGEAERSDFVRKLTNYLETNGLSLNVSDMTERSLLKRAVTKEQRKQILETFFRHLFAQVCTKPAHGCGEHSGKWRPAIYIN